MKSFVLFIALWAIIGTACTHTVQEEPGEQKRSIKQEEPGERKHPIKIESQLIQEGYELYGVIDVRKAIEKHTYLLAKDNDTQLKIFDTEGFSQIVREISSEEEALELARLLTSQELRPFLKDIYYNEIHEKNPEDEEDRWFAIESEKYEEWKMYEPVVTEENGVYKIERFVASYPRLQEGKFVKAQLLKIWEWIDKEGKYSMEIQEVITEGAAIQKILLITK